MKIREMTATFGNLNKATLRPGEGFTLISAPNESGKSTWAAFLRSMLYGFPARDRDKEGHLAEKNRYQPWSGAPMEGKVTLEWQGRDITLYRGPKGNTPWGAFSAVYTATGEAVPGLTGENCGEKLLGISREVFERTAFVGQGEGALSPSADLEKRVAALATTGEEEVSFSEVERRLLDWRNRRKVNTKVGLIPQLEGELAQTEEIIARQGELLHSIQEAQRAKEELEGRKAQLEGKLRDHENARSAQMSQRRAQAQADYDEALDKVERLKKTAGLLPTAEELRQAQGDLRYLNDLTADLRQADKDAPLALAQARQAEEEAQNDPYFGGKIPPQVAVQVQRDHSEAKRLEKKPSLPLWLLLGALLGTLLTALLTFAAPEAMLRLGRSLGILGGDFFTYATIFLNFILPLALIGLVLAGIICLLRRHSRKKALTALLAQYNVQTPEDILTRAADYNKKVENAQELRRKYEAVEADRAKLLSQKDALTARLLALVHPFEPSVTTVDGVSAAISRALQQGESYRMAENSLKSAEKLLSALPAPRSTAAGTVPVPVSEPEGDPEQLAAQLAGLTAQLSHVSEQAALIQGELQSLGDPAQAQARQSALTEALEQRRGEYDALSYALESLKNADSLLREKFSPAVNERAGHYLSLLTGGRYAKASLTRQFQALAQEEGGTAPRSDLSLSGGTVQQLYLAVRLAMCDLALPVEDPCPILLDDVLDPFDDGRAKLALDCLLDVAKTRQVLLFTCHSREKEMLKDAAVTVAELP